MNTGQSVVEHNQRGINKLFDRLMRRFMLHDKAKDADLDYLCKLASAMGYMAQTSASLNKNLYLEKDIRDIKAQLNRIPPEIWAEIRSPVVLEINNDR